MRWYRLNLLYWGSRYIGLDFYSMCLEEKYADSLKDDKDKYEEYTKILLRRGLLKKSLENKENRGVSLK